MAENKKYYTPKIEEFHIGFEYEIQDIENAQWGTIKQNSGFGAFDDDIDDLEEGRIRVKYLDEEDIIKLGYINKRIVDEELIEYTQRRYNTIPSTGNIILLERKTTKYHLFKELKKVFIGYIKNKSELERLLNQVGIK